MFVGNLPYTISEAQLKDIFSQAGQIENISVIIDRNTGQGKGFAFVEMATEEEAKKAIDLNGTKIDDRAIVVNEARPKEDRPNRSFGGRSDRPRSGFR